MADNFKTKPERISLLKYETGKARIWIIRFCGKKFRKYNFYTSEIFFSMKPFIISTREVFVRGGCKGSRRARRELIASTSTWWSGSNQHQERLSGEKKPKNKYPKNTSINDPGQSL